MTLLILCEPVWFRSSRLRISRMPSCAPRLWHSVMIDGRPEYCGVHPGELGSELRIDPRLVEGRFEFLTRRNQRLGNEPAAELAETTGGDRVVPTASRRSCAVVEWRSFEVPVVGNVVVAEVRLGGVGLRAFSMKRLTASAILLARCTLDAAGDIDAPRLHLGDRSADVLRGEATGQDQLHRVGRVAGERPVEDLAASPGSGASSRIMSVPY